MIEIERKDVEISLLKTAYKNTAEDLKTSQEIISSLKCALEIADTCFKWHEKTVKAQQEELVVWRLRSGN